MYIITATAKSIPSFFTRVFLGNAFLCILVTLFSLIGFIASVAWLLVATSIFELPWMDTLFDWFAFGASTTVAWFLFPALLPLIASLFQNKLLNRLEERYYNLNYPENDNSNIWQDIKFAFKAIGLNILILPTIFFPPAYVIVYYAMNGYLLGTEFFRVVSNRRITREESNLLIDNHWITVYGTGALITLGVNIPVINLILPLVAVVLMLHVFYVLRAASSQRITTQV
jgi:uncharacterized protein involved in cysteine biosynthesis